MSATDFPIRAETGIGLLIIDCRLLRISNAIIESMPKEAKGASKSAVNIW